MKALTVRQPFASAIALGFKDIENRRRRLPVGLPIVIHSARRLHAQAATARRLAPTLPETLPMGQLLCVVRFGEPLDVSECSSRWAVGPWCHPIELLGVLPDGLHCTGKLGLWTVPDALLSSFPENLRL